MEKRSRRIITYFLTAVIVSLFSAQLSDAQGSVSSQIQIAGIHFAQKTDRFYNPATYMLRHPIESSGNLAQFRSSVQDRSDTSVFYSLKTTEIHTTTRPTTLGTPIENMSGWVLTFADEFNGTQLDRNTWATEYGFDTECVVANPPPPEVTSYCNRSNNNEKEWYIDDAPKVENGVLRLMARINDCSGDNLPDRSYPPYSCTNFPYTSGMVSTHNHFSQLYGYFEARIKVPNGQGLWPAFWILPQLPPSSSPAEFYWPPEIDIMENKGQQVNSIYMTHLYSGVYPDPGSKLNDWSYGGFISSIFNGPDFSAGFHTYAIDWEPDVIIWYIDGIERFRSTQNLPPGRVMLPDYPGDMHLILDLAVGGAFVDNLLPDDSILPISLDIDYVRVYRKIAIESPFAVFLPTIASASH